MNIPPYSTASQPQQYQHNSPYHPASAAASYSAINSGAAAGSSTANYYNDHHIMSMAAGQQQPSPVLFSDTLPPQPLPASALTIPIPPVDNSNSSNLSADSGSNINATPTRVDRNNWPIKKQRTSDTEESTNTSPHDGDRNDDGGTSTKNNCSDEGAVTDVDVDTGTGTASTRNSVSSDDKNRNSPSSVSNDGAATSDSDKNKDSIKRNLSNSSGNIVSSSIPQMSDPAKALFQIKEEGDESSLNVGNDEEDVSKWVEGDGDDEDDVVVNGSVGSSGGNDEHFDMSML